MTFASESIESRRAPGPTSSRTAAATGALHSDAVKRVIDIMASDIEADYSTTELARSAGLSRFHFIRVFQEVSGTSPIRFLYAKRMQAALHRVITTNDSILQICLQSGYNSYGTFTRRFVELVGAPPSHLRTMSRKVQSSSLDVRTLLDRVNAASCPVEKTCIGGRVVGVDPHGLCVVGLFPSVAPAGPPIVCAIADQSGAFSMWPQLSLPSYQIFAVTLHLTQDVTKFILNSPLQVGKSGPFHVNDGRSSKEWLIRVRSSSAFDPPLLFPVGLYMLADLLDRTPFKQEV